VAIKIVSESKRVGFLRGAPCRGARKKKKAKKKKSPPGKISRSVNRNIGVD